MSSEEEEQPRPSLLMAALAMLLLLPLMQLLGSGGKGTKHATGGPGAEAGGPDALAASPTTNSSEAKKGEQIKAALHECAEAMQQWAERKAAIEARLQDPDAELSNIFNAEALRNPQQPAAAEEAKPDLQQLLQQATGQLQQYGAHMQELRQELAALGQ